MNRHHILFAALIVLARPALAQTEHEIAGRLTDTLRECERLPENSGTVDQAICYNDEVTRQDERLNNTWRRFTADLPTAELKDLRLDERMWIKQRDEECRHEKSYYINATAAYMFNLCLAREDIRRTIWLERGGRGPFTIPKQSGP
jgi:uncharacterized protein YecT (DUF1311 family)